LLLSEKYFLLQPTSPQERRNCAPIVIVIRLNLGGVFFAYGYRRYLFGG
jgi:hypothetical protein